MKQDQPPTEPEVVAESHHLKNTFQTPNWYVDQLLHLLTPGEAKVLQYAVRRIFGFNKQQDRISMRQFAEGARFVDGRVRDYGTGQSPEACREQVHKLEQFGILIRVAENDPRSNQGPLYALPLDVKQVKLIELEARQQEEAQRAQKQITKARSKRRGPVVEQKHPPCSSTTGPVVEDPLHPNYSTPPVVEQEAPPVVEQEAPPVVELQTQNPGETQSLNQRNPDVELSLQETSTCGERAALAALSPEHGTPPPASAKSHAPHSSESINGNPEMADQGSTPSGTLYPWSPERKLLFKDEELIPYVFALLRNLPDGVKQGEMTAIRRLGRDGVPVAFYAAVSAEVLERRNWQPTSPGYIATTAADYWKQYCEALEGTSAPVEPTRPRTTDQEIRRPNGRNQPAAGEHLDGFEAIARNAGWGDWGR